MKRITWMALLLLCTSSDGEAQKKGDVIVMTQNQYLGADLDGIVAADDLATFNQEVLSALASIASNDFASRAGVLAESIHERRPHLVGLQEVFEIACIDFGSGACGLLGTAFSDHLELTLDALSDLGADYRVAATVDNLVIPTPGFPLPGLPVFLDADLVPDAFITVRDRDVILARFDVPTVPVPYLCVRTSADGCNYDTVAVADTLLGEIRRERGFAGVDAVVAGMPYRFVTTHLEIEFPADDPLAPAIQAAQATQLLATMTAQPPAPGSRVLVVGDINSSPGDTVFPDPTVGPFHPPYMQLAEGVDLFGNPVAAPSWDVWDLRPGKPRGFTCCQLPDLSNPDSDHDERVDVIFSQSRPVRVRANALDDDLKTPTGLWPSDHFGVVAELTYE